MTDASAHPSPEGITPSERYLLRLCRRTFLRLWSWPNLYRDQGGPKELCDLLVVFGNHVLIFSDKACAFPDTRDLPRDWQRWFKKAVLKSVQQVRGAERWIRAYPNRIHLDAQLSKQFPLRLPLPDQAVFHRIVVAHGASLRCAQELGGTGSLMINTRLRTPGDHVQPFVVGQIDSGAGFVHILDDSSLEKLLETLDTIADFTDYLDRKEALIASRDAVVAAGEEELMAHYLQGVGADGKHDFRIKGSYNLVAFDVGFWADFEIHPDRIEQIRADKPSYLWDELIERFTKHHLAGTQYFRDDQPLTDFELGVRAMASEPRLRRRLLSKALISNAETGDTHAMAKRVIPGKGDRPSYVFLVLDPARFSSEQEYRVARGNLLKDCCIVARVKIVTTSQVVGLATEPSQAHWRSEDLVYLDEPVITEDMTASADELQSKLGLFTEIKYAGMHVAEYPADPAALRKGRSRNAPCPCGSGKKTKKCCGAS